jgi:hypothetical protein
MLNQEVFQIKNDAMRRIAILEDIFDRKTEVCSDSIDQVYAAKIQLIQHSLAWNSYGKESALDNLNCFFKNGGARG